MKWEKVVINPVMMFVGVKSLNSKTNKSQNQILGVKSFH